MGTLSNKSALVTGAAHGIGLAIASALLDAGCDVAAHYHELEDGVRVLTERAAAKGRRVFAIRADLTREEEATECVRAAVEKLGGLHVLVNNAGGMVQRRAVGELDAEYWRKVMDVNMATMAYVTKAALPALAKARGASIVNIASVAGRKGGRAGSIAYSTAKGAVLAWTRSLATEVASQGIRVNAVAPGTILGTRFHELHTSPEAIKAAPGSTPLGRAGEVGDVARPVVFLASEYDGFITGATLDVNGGVYSA
jgi:3-oxoacyl-[acyl-carrier protein] reductase